MSTDGALLQRVRKLLAKAEADGVTPAEAEALTAKAAELMARYGIDRALLAAQQPGTDQPADRIIDIPNPWARVQAHLLCGLASALRCQPVILPSTGPGTRIHIFGFASDIERTDILYTSVLVQMWRALAAAPVPAQARMAAQLAARIHHRCRAPDPRGRAARRTAGRSARSGIPVAGGTDSRQPAADHPAQPRTGLPRDTPVAGHLHRQRVRRRVYQRYPSRPRRPTPARHDRPRPGRR
jgi:Protein of unknown function (DUF2786)